MKKNVPKLSVKACACITLAVDVNSYAGVIAFKNVGIFVNNIIIMRVFNIVCVGCVNLISRVCVFTGMIDNGNSAELLNLADGSNVVARSANNSRAVINKK